MKRIVIDVIDESKLEHLLLFLKDINYIEIEDEDKMLEKIPEVFLNPIEVDNFKKFTREELH